jgi:hypothetical protein
MLDVAQHSGAVREEVSISSYLDWVDESESTWSLEKRIIVGIVKRHVAQYRSCTCVRHVLGQTETARISKR